MSMSASEMQSLSSVPVTVYSLLVDDPSDAYFITSDISECMLHGDQTSSLFSASDEVTVGCTVDFGQDSNRTDINSCALSSSSQQEDIISHSGPSVSGVAEDRHSDVNRSDKVFSMVQATLSANLFRIIGDDCALATLHRVCTACHVQVVYSCDTSSYVAVGSQTEDICRLERSLVKLLSEIRTSELISTATVECSLENACDVTTLQSVMPDHFAELHTDYGTTADDVSVFDGAGDSVILNQEDTVEECSANIAVTVVQLPLATKFNQVKKRGRPRKTQMTAEVPFQSSSTASEVFSSSFCTSEMVQSDWLIDVKNLEKHASSVETPDSFSATSTELQSQDIPLARTLDASQETFDKMLEEPCYYFCSQCPFRSKRIGQLRRHISLHSRDSPLVKYHFQTVRDNQVTCHDDDDDVTSPPDGDLSRDQEASRQQVKRRIVSAERIFACKLPGCGYRASTEYRALRHESRHRSIDVVVSGNSRVLTSQLVDRFCCKMCDYETVQRDLFRRHVNTVHGNMRPYLCDVCGRRYKRSDALAQHLVVHTAQESRVYHHQCQTCARKFRSLSHLTEHMSTHNSTRSFLCELCGAALKSRSAQRKHIQSIHVDPRSFQCPLCNRRFNTYFALRRHSRLHETDLTTTTTVDSKMTSSSGTRRLATKSPAVNEPRRSQKLSEMLSSFVGK